MKPGPTTFRQMAHTSVFRLAATYVAAFLVAGAVIVAIVFWQAGALLTRQVLQTLVAEADRFEAMAKAGGSTALAAAVAEKSRSPNTGLYLLIDADNRKLAGNLNRWPPELSASPEGGLFRYDAGEARLGERLAAGLAVRLPDSLRLLVGRDIEAERRFVDGVQRLVLIGSAVLAGLGIAGGLLASRALLVRVSDMTLASEQIMSGEFSRRIPVTGSDDELDRLAHRLNAMLDRIEQLMAGLREVSDNIAHDLKTPLNRMRNRAEACLRDAGGEAAYRDGLERCIEDADDLIKTFNALLLIAKLEAGSVEDSLDTFDLEHMLRDVAELYRPLTEESGLGLTLHESGPLAFHGNRQLLSQAVANLVDNAIKHGRGNRRTAGTAAPEPAPGIEIRLARTPAGVDITVSDRGVGIPAPDRRRVLERFVRLETSRTQPGTGLGLSLVAAVARLHGGSVRLEDNQPGARAVLSLPRRIPS